MYNQWTVFSDGFDPASSGMMLMESPVGDFDANEVLDASDVEMLSTRIRGELAQTWLLDEMFDISDDATVDEHDLAYWVHDVKQTWIGDGDLDGEFNSDDLIRALAANTYEQDVDATWLTGDFNASGRFDSLNLMDALDDGGYEKGPRRAMNAVPEPGHALYWPSD